MHVGARPTVKVADSPTRARAPNCCRVCLSPPVVGRCGAVPPARSHAGGASARFQTPCAERGPPTRQGRTRRGGRRAPREGAPAWGRGALRRGCGHARGRGHARHPAAATGSARAPRSPAGPAARDTPRGSPRLERAAHEQTCPKVGTNVAHGDQNLTRTGKIAANTWPEATKVSRRLVELGQTSTAFAKSGHMRPRVLPQPNCFLPEIPGARTDLATAWGDMAGGARGAVGVGSGDGY